METRSLMLVAPRRLAWQTELLSAPEADQVLVRARAGAISMGTELALYRDTTNHSRPLQYPLMIGYEAEVFAELAGQPVPPVKVLV